jgi:hypothetical protein
MEVIAGKKYIGRTFASVLQNTGHNDAVSIGTDCVEK